MRFFKSKRNSEAEQATSGEEAAARSLKGDLDSAVVPSMKAKEAEAPVEAVAPAAANADLPADTATMTATKTPDQNRETAMEPNVRLFPGFQDEPYEVGYAAFQSSEHGIEEQQPMLLLRWKTGEAKWFPVPPVFNKAILEQIHEEDNDLDRLLIGFGYDADQLKGK